MNIHFRIIVLSLLLLTCSDTPSSIDRTNTHDPDHIEYDLDNASSFNAEISGNRSITITWEDSLKLTDGFIIKKSLHGQNDEFVVLDTLPSDTLSYIDSTYSVTRDTKYSLTSFRIVGSDTLFSEPTKTTIPFSKPIQVRSEVSLDKGTITIDWDYESGWNFIPVISNYDLSNINYLDTLYQNEKTYQRSLSKEFIDQVLNVEFFISQEELGNPQYQSFEFFQDGYYPSVDGSAPHSVEYQVINEKHVELNWQANSDFEDGFNVYRKHQTQDDYTLIATLPPNSSSFSDTTQPFVPIDLVGGDFDVRDQTTEYLIDIFTDSTKMGSGIYIRVNAIELSIQKTINNGSEVIIDPNIYSSSPSPHSLILEQSTDGDNYISIDTIRVANNSNLPSITITPDTSNVEYFYRVKTLTSYTSGEIAVRYHKAIEEERIYSLPDPVRFRYSDSGSLIVVAQYWDLLNAFGEIAIFDAITGGRLYLGNPINEYITSIDIDETNNRVLLSAPRDSSLSIFDYNNNLVTKQIYDPRSFYSTFDPTNQFVYSSRDYGNLRKYDLSNDSLIYNIEPSGFSYGSSRNVALSHTGDTVATSFGGSINFYHAATGNDALITVDYIGNRNTVSHLQFSKSGKYFIFNSSNQTYIYDLENNVLINDHFPSHIGSISDDEKYYATHRYNDLNVYDVATKELVAATDKVPYIDANSPLYMMWVPNSNKIAIATKNGIMIYTMSSTKKWH